MNIFAGALLFKSKFFLGEKRVSNHIILPGTCWNKNDNFRIFTLNQIFPRGDQRWKIFLEPIQLCPWLLLFAEKRSILKSEQGGRTLSAEKKSPGKINVWPGAASKFTRQEYEYYTL